MSTLPFRLAAGLDWFSRRVLSWRALITPKAGPCLDAVESACPAWPAGRPQRRPGKPAHQRRPHWPALTGLPSLACRSGTTSRSAWTAAAPGVATCSSSDSGVRSNTRRSPCEPTTASARHAPRSADIWSSAGEGARTRASTRGRRIKPLSVTCRRSRQHGRRRRWRGVASVGRRPSCTPPRQRYQSMTIGTGPTDPKRSSVSTKPATSQRGRAMDPSWFRPGSRHASRSRFWRGSAMVRQGNALLAAST